MTNQEFVSKWLGAPWVDRGVSVDGVDCWGLVVAYYKEVLGIELVHPSEYMHIESGFNDQVNSGLWKQVDKTDCGVVFTSFIGDVPTHVGICIDKRKVIHCQGSVDKHGAVAVHTIRSLKKCLGDNVKFYEYVNHG